MIFRNAVVTLALAGLVSVPAFAAKTFTCEQTTDASGNTIYLPVKTVAKSKAKAKHRRVARRAPAKRVAPVVVEQREEISTDETRTVDAAPAYVEPAPAPAAEPVVREKTAAERRAEWLREHTPAEPIYGNMSGWAGRSTISYLHGTDNAFGKVAMNYDEGPSVGGVDYRNTATEGSDSDF